MKNIIAYVEQQNRFRKLFKDEELHIGVHNEMIGSLLEMDLSPENLTCDGELRGPALMKKKKFLVAAAKELMKSDKSIRIGF